MAKNKGFIPIPQSYIDIIEKDKNHKCSPPKHHFCIKVVSAAKLFSPFMKFIVTGFLQTSDDKENTAFVKGMLFEKRD
ncbi:MAG: hypothetical protein ACXADY_20145 [Candidatus Hodarchaeales archaeon]|jgi:hypothetical protein